jgi:hypothetical protein
LVPGVVDANLIPPLIQDFIANGFNGKVAGPDVLHAAIENPSPCILGLDIQLVQDGFDQMYWSVFGVDGRTVPILLWDLEVVVLFDPVPDESDDPGSLRIVLSFFCGEGELAGSHDSSLLCPYWL